MALIISPCEICKGYSKDLNNLTRSMIDERSSFSHLLLMDKTEEAIKQMKELNLAGMEKQILGGCSTCKEGLAVYNNGFLENMLTILKEIAPFYDPRKTWSEENEGVIAGGMLALIMDQRNKTSKEATFWKSPLIDKVLRNGLEGLFKNS